MAMHNKHLQQIHDKFSKVIERNFDAEFIADVVFMSSDKKTSMFIVKDNKILINCFSDLDVSSLNKGDMIRIRGVIKPNKTRLGSIDVIITFFYLIRDEERLKEPIQSYHQIKQQVLRQKTQERLVTIKNKKLPISVITIGLIVFENDKPQESISVSVLDLFVEQFKQKCKGHLIIYSLKPPMLLTDALDYFDKITDMICILTGKLTLDQILYLSIDSIVNDVYKYVKRSKSYVSAVSHIPHSPNTNMTDCLCYYMTNRQFNSVNECIDLIASIQSAYEKMILDSLTDKYNEINQIISFHEKRLSYIESYINSMDISPDNSIEQLKNAICNKLDKEKDRLVNIELSILSRILTHWTNLVEDTNPINTSNSIELIEPTDPLEKKIEEKNHNIKENNPMIDNITITNTNGNK